MNSARSVAIATASACSQRKMRVGLEKLRGADLGEVCPVAMPSLALIVWMSMAIRFEARMTHSSR